MLGKELLNKCLIFLLLVYPYGSGRGQNEKTKLDSIEQRIDNVTRRVNIVAAKVDKTAPKVNDNIDKAKEIIEILNDIPAVAKQQSVSKKKTPEYGKPEKNVPIKEYSEPCEVIITPYVPVYGSSERNIRPTRKQVRGIVGPLGSIKAFYKEWDKKYSNEK